ncbi:hypothetical protein RJ45_14745 [Photobacterium gaetbulicola]|uniref:Uncharacterized protein n=1 Tax=Photobacterium gaetbulicola TaxID=1295392 RepID=A0A0B9H249_9GAMM|nr:hypothetical protein [Photobacterium gaetbulicola]KHT62897.1 hypothetical protein RJ45_14745 [Photobacterium gaetbulicola]
MLSPISAAINKLLRIEPQQLKADQFTPSLPQGAKQGASQQPSNSASPLQILPQAQWQVVRMLASSSAMVLSHTAAYSAPPLQSSSFRLTGGEGELQVRVQVEGQPHILRWQVSQGEVQQLSSTLPAGLSLALLPTVDQGWRLVAKGFLHHEPLQLLWSPYGNSANAGAGMETALSLKIWLRIGLIITVIVFSLCYWLF